MLSLRPRSRDPARAVGALASLITVALFAATALAVGPFRVTERSLDYSGSEGDMPARFYAPEESGRRPAVLVLHTAAGPGPNVEAFARRLASHGFVALTPDLFALHDFGADGRADHPLVLGDLDGALRFLADHPAVDASRIAVVGFSFGGRMAVIAAAGHARIKAAVVYYAVASYQELARDRPVAGRALRTRPLAELAASIDAPVLIHHGEADRSVPPSQGVLLQQALRGAGKASVLHLYPGADHLFNFELGPDAPTLFKREAATLSWERTLDFLRTHLDAH